MTHRFGILRRFRFNRPQRIAAALLLVFLVQGFFLISRQPLTDQDYQYARCGREMWEKPSPLAGYFTTCGNIHDGVLAYRLAGLPLTLNLLAERGLDRLRKPEDRVVQTSGEINTWELRHQLTHISLLLRLPFLFAGCVLGGCLWWVTRRLYGNRGGYMALALYCFSPAILKTCAAPNPEVLSALAVYGGVYTCIGVAHSMLGPPRKWRPRIVLLAICFGAAAASHIAALPLAAVLGLVAMFWVAEGRRSLVLPIVLIAVAGALVLTFATYGFSPDAFSYLFRSNAGFLGFSADPARRFFSSLGNAGITCAALASVALYAGLRKARYYGNTAPLLCALVLMLLVTTGVPGSPWLWALPFLLTFIAGVFADAFDTPGRSRVSIAAAAALVTLQATFCGMTLAGLFDRIQP
jgi:hypothetical protein